jgi:hypothetical protein
MPSFAVPGYAVSTNFRFSQSFRAGKECYLVDLGGVQAQVALDLADFKGYPAEVPCEEIRKFLWR